MKLKGCPQLPFATWSAGRTVKTSMLLKALFISHRAGNVFNPRQACRRYGHDARDLRYLAVHRHCLSFDYGCGVGDGADAGADDVVDEGEVEDEGGSG